jgi:nucleoside-diphosphate-sugar epimerase
MGRMDIQYVIIGVTGWLGRATFDFIKRTHVAISPALIVPFASSECSLTLENGEKVFVHALDKIKEFKPSKPVIIFHYAFCTKDKLAGLDHEQYRKANFLIREKVDYALKNWDIVGAVLSSSGAVHYHLSNTRSSDSLSLYGKGKLEDEEFFLELSQKMKFRMVMPRIFNLSGHYINKLNLYALSAILMNCLREKDIVLQANHPVWRSYYGVNDLIELLISILGDPDEVPSIFDVAGLEVTEISELAFRCRQLVGRESLRVIRPFVNPEPNNFYVGNPQIIRKLEERYQIVPSSLDHQILTTANYLKKLL